MSPSALGACGSVKTRAPCAGADVSHGRKFGPQTELGRPARGGGESFGNFARRRGGAFGDVCGPVSGPVRWSCGLSDRAVRHIPEALVIFGDGGGAPLGHGKEIKDPRPTARCRFPWRSRNGGARGDARKSPLLVFKKPFLLSACSWCYQG